MANYRVISSDNHVFESPDLWTSRAKPAFKDRVPQLVREYDGDWWYCDGHRVIGLSPGAQTGMRFEAPEKMVRTTTFDRVRRGGYVPEAVARCWAIFLGTLAGPFADGSDPRLLGLLDPEERAR